MHVSVLAQNTGYQAGYKILRLYDSSRRYQPNASTSHPLHFRMIETDVWYPAEVGANDTPALFFDFVKLLEIRAKVYDDTRDYTGISEELLQYICGQSDCLDYNSLKEIRTASYRDATPVQDKFPLVVYLASMNGMSYENYLMFEALARKGFIVAVVSSIGRHPGNMTSEFEDLMEQVADAVAIIEYMTNREWVNGKTALIGYSWGGLAANLLSAKDPLRYHAVISLDGSEQFQYYGNEDDEKLNRIRASDVFKPEMIVAPYLYLESDDAEEEIPDSTFVITKHLTGEKQYLKILNSKHEDFSSINVHLNQTSMRHHSLVQMLVVDFLSNKLKGDDTFYNNIPLDRVDSNFFQSAKQSGKDNKLITGIIVDKKTNLPLPYVNIGITDKDVGTASDIHRRFTLQIPRLNAHDTLNISMVGYQTEKLHLHEIVRATKKAHTIYLREKVKQLQEFVFTGKRSSTRVFGNKTESKFFGGKFSSSDFGSEMAIKINVGSKSVHLDKFKFNVSYNTEDSVTFRLNIYNEKDGLPKENILRENILIRIGKQTGNIEIDLSKYNIVVNDKIFVSLEYIGGSRNSGIVFSAGFANRGTYYRKTSQSRWRKYPMGVGFNVSGTY